MSISIFLFNYVADYLTNVAKFSYLKAKLAQDLH